MVTVGLSLVKMYYSGVSDVDKAGVGENAWVGAGDIWEISVPTSQFCSKPKVKVAQSCSTLCDPMDSIVSPWNSPCQNTGVGSLSLLQGIFPTQVWNRGLSHCRRILYQLSHKGSPLTPKKKSLKNKRTAIISDLRKVMVTLTFNFMCIYLLNLSGTFDIQPLC